MLVAILSFLAGLVIGIFIGIVYIINKMHEVYEDSL